MTCDVPARECLHDHIRPKLAHAKITSSGRTVRARCPVCGNHDSLTVSAGDYQPITWNCFAGCDAAGVRSALVRAGVASGCLPRARRTPAEAAAEALREGTRKDRAETLLRAYLICLGYRHWPKGRELAGRAAEVGISCRSGYKAREAGPLLPSPRTASTSHTARAVVKFPESSQVSEVVAKREGVQPTTLVQPTALTKVQPTALFPAHGWHQGMAPTGSDGKP